MKKSIKKAVSLLLFFSLLLCPVNILESNAQTTSLDMFLQRNFRNYVYGKEYIDGVRYAYVVLNGEAAIVNIFTNFYNTGEKTLVLPSEINGYDVTMLGYTDSKSYLDYGNINIDVFMYYNDGESIEETFPDADYTEYDIGIDGITLVIPEGYEHIMPGALNYFKGNIEFPKSLKTVCHIWSLGENFFRDSSLVKLPECQYGVFAPDFIQKSYVLPSRCPDVLYNIRDNREYNIYNDYIKPKSLYIPNSASADVVSTGLYPYGSAYYSGTVIYCAKDSEAYAVIKENGGYTVNTNAPYAEYIEFPEDNVNIRVGDVLDLEAKSYPENATWTACDYTVSDPSIVKIDEYSGRITALKEGTVTVTATHCERGYVDTCTVNVTTKPAPGVNGIEPATDTPYVTYGNRDYKVNVTGSPSKIQVVRDNGGTTTIDRRKAQVTSNGDTETWIVNMRVEAGTHNIRAKYGKVWEERLTSFTVKYDLPGAYSFDLTYQNGIGIFDAVTDPEVIKIQFALDNGCTLTYSQVYSHIGEDGLRHWEISRKLPSDMQYTLKTKYGYTWTTTEFTVTT